MMSKLKSCLANSSSALALAVALLAFSFAFGPFQAYAEDVEMLSCSPPTDVMDATVAEEFDVLCNSSAAETITSDVVVLNTADEVANPASLETPQVTAETSLPSAIEGEAIPLEITQSVTVAVRGDSTEEAEYTGSVPATAAPVDVTADPEAGFDLD